MTKAKAKQKLAHSSDETAKAKAKAKALMPIGKPFPPGVSGNPGGRPALPEWFRARGEEALRVLCDVMAGKRIDDKVSPAQAAQVVVERIYGRPSQSVELSGQGLTPGAAALLELVRLRRAEAEAAADTDRGSGDQP